MEQLVFSPKALGSAIKRERKLRKLNQKLAGADVGLEQSTVSSIEYGAGGTRLDTIFRMLAALDLEMVIRPKKKSETLKNEKW
jgi:HTH-type transcriptional regulator/antitoxin HipB